MQYNWTILRVKYNKTTDEIVEIEYECAHNHKLIGNVKGSVQVEGLMFSVNTDEDVLALLMTEVGNDLEATLLLQEQALALADEQNPYAYGKPKMKDKDKDKA